MSSIFSSLRLMIASSTQRELARQFKYLKVENQILRGKLPARITITLKADDSATSRTADVPPERHPGCCENVGELASRHHPLAWFFCSFCGHHCHSIATFLAVRRDTSFFAYDLLTPKLTRLEFNATETQYQIATASRAFGTFASLFAPLPLRFGPHDESPARSIVLRRAGYGLALLR